MDEQLDFVSAYVAIRERARLRLLWEAHKAVWPELLLDAHLVIEFFDELLAPAPRRGVEGPTPFDVPARDRTAVQGAGTSPASGRG